MKLLRAIIRPTKLEDVIQRLSTLEINGLTVTDVRGHGHQKGHTEFYRGEEYGVTLLPRVMLDIILPDERVAEVLKAVIAGAETGMVGDGRVFVLPVEESYNIRTGKGDVTPTAESLACA